MPGVCCGLLEEINCEGSTGSAAANWCCDSAATAATFPIFLLPPLHNAAWCPRRWAWCCPPQYCLTIHQLTRCAATYWPPRQASPLTHLPLMPTQCSVYGNFNHTSPHHDCSCLRHWRRAANRLCCQHIRRIPWLQQATAHSNQANAHVPPASSAALRPRVQATIVGPQVTCTQCILCCRDPAD